MVCASTAGNTNGVDRAREKKRVCAGISAVPSERGSIPAGLRGFLLRFRFPHISLTDVRLVSVAKLVEG